MELSHGWELFLIRKMDGGDSETEFRDPRLTYMYDFLVKSWKTKPDVIDAMMQISEMNVSI